MKTSYVLVSPCKDEALYIEKTILSIKNQSIPPAQWIIVDDGSSDSSMDIVKRYMPTMPYIKIVTRTPQTGRNVGAGVIMAFNDGLPAIDVPYDFLCKFDVDVELHPLYFETLLHKMDEDPLLGTCSGKAYYYDEKTGALRSELCGDEASVGMIKFYRKECFYAIGGFQVQVGWDGFDCHMARWHGWRAMSWDAPDALRFIHLRPMGSSQKSIYRGRIRHGKGQYHQGTHPLFFLASSLFRCFKQKPYVLGTLYSLYGYLKAAWDKEPRFGSEDITRFIHAYQLRALFHGKKESAEWAFQQRRAVISKGT